MKKTRLLYAALLALVVATAFTSCKQEVDDIFDKNAADRLTDAMNNYSDLLCANGGLWAMEYFSSSSIQGYVLLMKFEKNGHVTMYANYDATTAGEFESDESEWGIIGDNGPVLTFNTYNEILHVFADPSYSPRGRGFEGDYEFNLMGYRNDTIFLNGKKHNIDMLMYRLPESTDISTFYSTVYDMQTSAYLEDYFPVLRMLGANGHEYIVTGLGSDKVSFYPRMGDAITQTVDATPIVTPKGFYFLDDLALPNPDGSASNLTVRHFELQQDGSFLCTDDGVTVIVALDWQTLFDDKTYTWQIQVEGLGGRFAELYQEIDAESNRLNRRRLTYVNYAFNSDPNFACMSFLFQTGTRACHFGVESMGFTGDKVQFVLNDKRNANATSLANSVPATQEWFDLIADGTYTLSSESRLNVRYIKFTSDKNQSNYFTLYIYQRNKEEGSGDVN